jgi:hypothetical protein
LILVIRRRSEQTGEKSYLGFPNESRRLMERIAMIDETIDLD